MALDESYQGENEGRFRIFNEDFFGNRVIWDSGKMTKDTPAKEIDIELEGYRCLMLVFEGRNIETGKRQMMFSVSLPTHELSLTTKKPFYRNNKEFHEKKRMERIKRD